MTVDTWKPEKKEEAVQPTPLDTKIEDLPF